NVDVADRRVAGNNGRKIDRDCPGNGWLGKAGDEGREGGKPIGCRDFRGRILLVSTCIEPDLRAVSDDGKEWFGAKSDFGMTVGCIRILCRAGCQSKLLDPQPLMVEREAPRHSI